MERIFFKRYLRLTLIGLIVIFIGWISLFGEPLQSKYKDLTFWGLAFLLFISLLYKRPKNFSLVDLTFLIYLFIVTMGLIFFCENKVVALERYRMTFLPIPLLYFSLRVRDKHFIFPISWIIFFFSILIVFLGLLEAIFHKNIIYELWIENPYYYRFIYSTPRIMSTLIHPTILGSFLVGCLPFSLFLASYIKAPYKLFIKICLFLIMSGIIFSFSRGNILGLLGSVIIYLFLTEKKQYIKFILTGLLTLVILSSTILKHKFCFSRFSLSGLSSGWWTAEIEKSSIALKMLKEHPLIGIGLNHYRLKFDNYSSAQYKLSEEKVKQSGRDPYEWKIPDNNYLSILAETGLLGFSAFILFLWLLFKKSFMLLKKIKEDLEKRFFVACICALVGLLLSMNTYDLFYWINPLLLFWFLAGTLRAIELYAQN